eukprot:s1851_g11.t1
MEEKALWQYTKDVYANQVDTFTFDAVLMGIVERIEEQWQISVTTDDLEIRYDENHGLEVFQVMCHLFDPECIFPDRLPRVIPRIADVSALDYPTVYTAQLLTTLRSLPQSAPPDEIRNQMITIVQDSQLPSMFTSQDLHTLGHQIHQLADLLSEATAPPSDVLLTLADNSLL